MDESREDFKELLLTLNAAGVEYLIVGGHAMMKHGYPMYTKDIDIWVANTPENSARLYNALAEFGAPLESNDIRPDSFTENFFIYQMGVPPVRIDVMSGVSGLDFAGAWNNRVIGQLYEVQTYFISLEDLVKNKLASGRPSDLEHVKLIEREQKRKKK